jgi:hypothetical protein
MVTSVIPAISSAMKLRKRLTASEQESEISKTVEEGTQQR